MSDTLLPEKAIQEALAELPGWRLEAGRLHREYRCNGWRAAVLLFDGIAHLAEAAWHHPDVTVSWGRVAVSLTTHSAGGITRKDLELAAEIERLATWQPAPGAALEGAPEEGCWRYREPE